MDIYDKMCFTVSSAGGRRGAQMGTFDVSHPDVRDFIRAKREDGRLRQFNLSLLITDGFMDAVKQDAEWPLVFPLSDKEVGEVDLADAQQIVWRDWPTTRGYIVRDDGLVACKVYGQVRARHLWDMIMVSTYDYAEPGFILIDRVNEMNNNWWCENIRATNPCGEQPLPPYGACLLGSLLVCLHGWGASVAVAAWLGVLTFAALFTGLMLTYAPRQLRTVATVFAVLAVGGVGLLR